jgi:thiol-disulfide isomerase/thioredoxin
MKSVPQHAHDERGHGTQRSKKMNIQKILNSRRFRYLTLASWLLTLFFVGCSARTKNMELATENILRIDSAGLAEFVSQHRGRVVLIDFWATWCTSCVKLFPHNVELYERLADRGLMVAGVSLDDPEDHLAVIHFLAEKGAKFPNFISPYGPSGRSAEEFNITGGGIPFLHIYDRQGKLIKTLGGDRPVEPQEIDLAVEQALNSS